MYNIRLNFAVVILSVIVCTAIAVLHNPLTASVVLFILIGFWEFVSQKPTHRKVRSREENASARM